MFITRVRMRKKVATGHTLHDGGGHVRPFVRTLPGRQTPVIVWVPTPSSLLLYSSKKSFRLQIAPNNTIVWGVLKHESRSGDSNVGTMVPDLRGSLWTYVVC